MLLRRNSPKSNDVERGHAGILFLYAGSHQTDLWGLGELALMMCLKMAVEQLTPIHVKHICL